MSQDVFAALKGRQNLQKSIISANFKTGSSTEGIVLEEAQFNKAIVELNLEVYTVDGFVKFNQDLRKSIESGKMTSDDIEKARKNLSGLIKVTKRDSAGRNMTYWVKNKEQEQKKDDTKGRKSDNLSDEEKKQVSSIDKRISTISDFLKRTEGTDSGVVRSDRYKKNKELDSLKRKYKKITGNEHGESSTSNKNSAPSTGKEDRERTQSKDSDEDDKLSRNLKEDEKKFDNEMKNRDDKEKIVSKIIKEKHGKEFRSDLVGQYSSEGWHGEAKKLWSMDLSQLKKIGTDKKESKESAYDNATDKELKDFEDATGGRFGDEKKYESAFNKWHKNKDIKKSELSEAWNVLGVDLEK